MVWRPKNAGPRTIRELYHWAWTSLRDLGKSTTEDIEAAEPHGVWNAIDQHTDINKTATAQSQAAGGASTAKEIPDDKDVLIWNDGISLYDSRQVLVNSDVADVIIGPDPTLKGGQALIWDDILGAWKNRAPGGEAYPTGLIDGGELNISLTPGNIEVIGGAGVIINSYDEPNEPFRYTLLTWPTLDVPITAPAIAGTGAFFTIENTGTPTGSGTGQQTVYLGRLKEYAETPSPSAIRDEIFIGVVVHNGTAWKEVSSPVVVNNTAHTLDDFLSRVAGPSFVVDGGAIAEAPLYTLHRDAGTIWERNRNWHVDKKDPHREAFPEANPMQWRYTNRDFTDVSGLVSTADPTQWDDNGTVSPVPGPANAATIQRVYIDLADNVWVMWGQNWYDSFDEALALIGADGAETTFPPLLASSVLMGYIVAEKNNPDWSFEQARFIVAADRQSGGGGGSPITDHDNLNGINPDNHHNQVHQWWGTDHSDMAAQLPVETQGAFLQAAEFIADYRNKYIATYAEGPTYYPQQWVNNFSYIAIANAETTDPAFPTLIGDPTAVYPTSPPFLEASHVGQVRSGFLSTYTQSGEITATAVWIPEVSVDTHYTFVVIVDPNGNPQLQRYQLRNENLTPNAWNIVSVGSLVVVPGLEILTYLESHNYGAATQVTGGWTYGGQENTAAPATSEWNHNNAQTTLRIDKTDLDVVDRTTELLGIITGSTILFAETASPANTITYTTLGPPVDSGTYISYPVSLTGSVGIIGAAQPTTMTADVPVAQATKFVYETDKFLVDPAFATITSYLQYDDADQPVSDDIGYGINYNFQQLSQSPDWDLVPIGGGGGGGAGDFTPETFTGGGTTGYVPDPVSENGYVLRDDGTWYGIDHVDLLNIGTNTHAQIDTHIADTDIHFSDANADSKEYVRFNNTWVEAAGGGATEASITQVAHGFAVMDCVRWDGVAWVLALANDVNTTALGVVVEVIDPDNFKYAMSGQYTFVHGLAPEEWYYLHPGSPGALTSSEPDISQPIVYTHTADTYSIYPYRPTVASAAAGLPDGTNEGEVLRWDGINGLWEPNDFIKLDTINSHVMINPDGFDETLATNTVSVSSDLAVFDTAAQATLALHSHREIIAPDYELGRVNYNGAYDNAGTLATSTTASIRAASSEIWSSSARGTKLRFLTVSDGSTALTERMSIDGAGDVIVAQDLTAATFTGNGAGVTNVDAVTLNGKVNSTANSTSTIVERDANGYIYGNYINMVNSASNTGASTMGGVFIGTNGSDTFMRSYTPAAAAANMGAVTLTGTQSITGTKYFHSTGTGPLASNTSTLQAYGSASDGAWMAFHRPGAYAINLGLDTSNNFVLGGWSATTTPRVSVTSAGYVGIGVLSPNHPLQVEGVAKFGETAGNAHVYAYSFLGTGFIGTFDNSGPFSGAVYKPTQLSGQSVAIVAASSTLTLRTNAAQDMLFSTNNTERMRILSGGGVTMASTLTLGSAAPGVSTGIFSAQGIVSRRGTNQAGSFGNPYNFDWVSGTLDCWIDSVRVGQVSLISDYRIKKDVIDFPYSGIEAVKKLRPVNYTRKNNTEEFDGIFAEAEDGIIRTGFIAHELQEVIPSAVAGEKDSPNAVQSIVPDALLAVLTKAIQEQQEQIDELRELLNV